MLFEKLIRFIKGSVTITAKGKFPERFLNVCANKEIIVTNVEYLSENCIMCTMSLAAFEEIDAISKKTFVTIDVISKKGLPIILSKYKKRFIVLIGPAFFVVSLFVLNLFVWDIEIVGCEKVLPKEIENNLKELGVRQGVLRFLIDETDVKSEMLMKMPELSWLWVDKRGSKIIVSVRESVPKPEIFDMDDYCNIIAAKDGIIDSAIVKSGTPLFELGATVRKNDILVSGLMLSEKNIEPRKVQADAEVYARVWYEKTEEFSLQEEKKTETGNVKKIRSYKIFGWEFTPFWSKKPEYEKYTMEEKVFEPCILGKYIGIKITTNTYKEYKSQLISLAEDTVVSSGVNSILQNMEEKTAPESKRAEYTSSYVKNDDNTVTVTVVCEYIENIAQKVRVE